MTTNGTLVTKEKAKAFIEAGLRGVEALQVRAATATGAAALRMAYFAVASGSANLAVALGVEKMSDGDPVPALAKALDAETEVPHGATLLSQNAHIMQAYIEKYGVPVEAFTNFALNAHTNARTNPNALFQNKTVTVEEINASRVIVPPMRLYDAAPICDGAAAVVLARTDEAKKISPYSVRVLGSSVATDWFALEDRANPLDLYAVQRATWQALGDAEMTLKDIDFFEAHDAFTIMTCLALEAIGFTERGQGWRMAAENRIGLEGDLPLCTFGGLKARGHPIGASAIYQTCEIALQLTGRAGPNQVKNAETALLLSVGGVASTVISHVFAV
ncbi:MAG: thiolase domain-containing protein [Anaerolineales bacterium]|nr:thiolase domain-containing protein [Anaerolineales bacterium]